MTEAEIRALVDDIPGAALYQLLRHPDGSGRYLYVSAGIQQIVGMTAEQVIADAPAFDALILEADWRGLRAAADAAIATMSPYEIEIRQRTLRGDIRWVHCRATPRERLADGSVIWGGVVVDVTERKRVEEELREREALLRNLSDNLPDATIYQDGSNYFPYISEGQASTYGLTREQVIADPSRVYGLVVDEDLKKLRATADESLRTLTSMEVECRQRTARGEERWVQIRARPRRLPDGSTLWDAVALDITERKRAEEALRERETQLRNLGDNLPGVVYQVVRRSDGSNYFPYMSSGLYATFGLPAGEALTNPAAIYDLIVPDDARRLRTAADESIRTGTPFDVECRLCTPSGEHRWLQLRGRPRMHADGSTLWDAVALDVTDRRRLEAREAEVQRLESLGVIAAGMAHDFNNLLTIIMGHAALLHDALPPGSPGRPGLDRIEGAARRSAELTQQLLAYAGRALVRPAPLDLSQVATEAVSRFQRGATPERAVRLELESVPPVHADAGPMHWVALALLANAHEALTGAAGTITVRTGVRHAARGFLDSTPLGGELPEGDYAYLEVTDTGVGMDEATQARMFEPFFSTSSSAEAWGLRLCSVFCVVIRGPSMSRAKLGKEPASRSWFRNETRPRKSSQGELWSASIIGEVGKLRCAVVGRVHHPKRAPATTKSTAWISPRRSGISAPFAAPVAR